MWKWVGYIYIWTKASEFTVQTFLDCMCHLPGSTGQAANSSMICTYLPSLLPTTLVLCYPRMEWPSSRMGWPYNYIGRILLMLVTSSRVDAQAYPKHAVFRYHIWSISICLEKTWKLVGRTLVSVRLEFRWWKLTWASCRRQLCGSGLSML